jgi:hypothetical protein
MQANYYTLVGRNKKTPCVTALSNQPQGISRYLSLPLNLSPVLEPKHQPAVRQHRNPVNGSRPKFIIKLGDALFARGKPFDECFEDSRLDIFLGNVGRFTFFTVFVLFIAPPYHTAVFTGAVPHFRDAF